MPKQLALVEPRSCRIWPGVKTTYLDIAIKEKRGVPAAKYQTSGSLTRGHKSNWEKKSRASFIEQLQAKLKKDSFPAMKYN